MILHEIEIRTRLAQKQAQLSCALAILGKVISNILISKYEQSELVRDLPEMGRTLADSHNLETGTRRSLIILVIDKTYIFLSKREGGMFIYSARI